MASPGAPASDRSEANVRRRACQEKSTLSPSGNVNSSDMPAAVRRSRIRSAARGRQSSPWLWGTRSRSPRACGRRAWPTLRPSTNRARSPRPRAEAPFACPTLTWAIRASRARRRAQGAPDGEPAGDARRATSRPCRHHRRAGRAPRRLAVRLSPPTRSRPKCRSERAQQSSFSVSTRVHCTISSGSGVHIGGTAPRSATSPSLSVSFMVDRFIEEPEARYLWLEGRTRPRQGPLHLPAWMNPLSPLGAPDSGLGVPLSCEGWPRPSDG